MSGFESIFMHPQYLQLAVELNFVSQHVKMVAFPWKQNQNFLRRDAHLTRSTSSLRMKSWLGACHLLLTKYVYLDLSVAGWC